MEPSRYFDHAATTPLDPRVLEEMLPYMRSDWGNANSLHAWGRKASAAVEKARERLASLLGVSPEEMFFTSGATEANNWVLRAFDRAAISPFEHSSLYEPAQALGKVILRNEGLEVLPPAEECELVSVMAVNNELGARWPVPLHVGDWQTHSDITQAAGKLPVDLGGVDFASLSAHKFYGPKGIGALYAREGAAPEPLLRGGEQEMGARGGTLNVPGIVGLGAAAAIAEQEWEANLEHAKALRLAVLEALASIPDHQVNGCGREGEGSDTLTPSSSPYILNLSFLGVEGETLVVEMDAQGFGISSGAACSSRSAEPSHVLRAMGLPSEWLRGSIRISFGPGNTPESAQAVGQAIGLTVDRLRNLRTF